MFGAAKGVRNTANVVEPQQTDRERAQMLGFGMGSKPI